MLAVVAVELRWSQWSRAVLSLSLSLILASHDQGVSLSSFSSTTISSMANLETHLMGVGHLVLMGADLL